MYTTLTTVKLKPKINLGLNRIRTHGPCNFGAVPYQLNYHANLELVTLLVRTMPVDGEECK